MAFNFQLLDNGSVTILFICTSVAFYLSWQWSFTHLIGAFIQFYLHLLAPWHFIHLDNEVLPNWLVFLVSFISTSMAFYPSWQWSFTQLTGVLVSFISTSLAFYPALQWSFTQLTGVFIPFYLHLLAPWHFIHLDNEVLPYWLVFLVSFIFTS